MRFRGIVLALASSVRSIRRGGLLVAVALATTLCASDASHAHYRGYWGGYYYGPRVGVYFAGPWYAGPSWYWGARWYGYPYGYAGWPYGYGYGYPYGYPYGFGYSWRYDPPIRYGLPPASYVEAPARSEPSGSWYYCNDPPGYYPYVSRCSRPWLEVEPFSTGSGGAAPPKP
jgi:hypothetical protein